MKLHMLASLLLIVGGLNWLALGLTGGWDVGVLLGGQMALASRVIYVLVGLSAVYELLTHRGRCADCK